MQILGFAAVAAVIATTDASGAGTAAGAANVTASRLGHANSEPGDWMSVGRTYDEQRFSPLTQINRGNVSRLHLAWYADFDTNRGQEASPLAIDGVLYLSTAWSKVEAFDAKTGKRLWEYDPKVPGEFAGRGCCDVVNRGVAAWRGRIYVASYDGRLIALDAKTGAVVWQVLTVDHDKPYTSTGAPRIVKGRVLIGNAGGELGVRGYLSAYDAETGKLDWRFYTVPGNPANGFESRIMRKAAATWHGDWWTVGGGAGVWDGMAYDPHLNLVYFGTGNGTPWNRAYRGSGGGDNWFVSSIIAVNADTGAYVWHYQVVPGEEWDYDSTSPMILADLTIGGRARRVLMQASKDGYFYVLDARTGKLISANQYVPANWTSGIDLATGRPRISREVRYDLTGKPAFVQPGGQGAHSWHPISYSPQTGLVYFSAIGNTSTNMMSAKSFTPQPMGSNTGLSFQAPRPGAARVRPTPAESELVAWDPVRQRQVWRTGVLGTIGAGTLATAGGLVFQGTTKGRFVAYDASNGTPLWSMDAETGVVAAPISYEAGGEQYIAEEVGYGLVRFGMTNGSRLLVFKLGGTASLPPAPPSPPPPVLNPPPSTASAQTIDLGRRQFGAHCAMCHDTQYANRNVFPDLRYAPELNSEVAFEAIVLQGALQAGGMASFKGRVSADQVHAIRAYLIARANELKSSPASGAGPPR
ncbi:MAG: PQQ-dependent dehydrogenase, methanol/ethanol family [Steroidobacteraceae bacterium]